MATGTAGTRLAARGSFPCLVLGILATAGGCADRFEAPPELPPVLVRDSAGIQIIENRAPAWGPGEGWTVGPEPIFTFEEAPDAFLQEPHDFRLTSRGEVAVADYATNQILVIDPVDGRVDVLGRPGEGPGEFGRLVTIDVLPGDSILAWDQSLGRGTVFGPDHEVARTFRGPTPSVATEVRPGIDLELMRFMPIGDGFRPEALGIHRRDAYLIRLDREGGVIDTLAALPGKASHVKEASVGTAYFGSESFAQGHRGVLWAGGWARSSSPRASD